MIRRPPRSTRTDTLFPYTTLFRSTGRAGRRSWGISLTFLLQVEGEADGEVARLAGVDPVVAVRALVIFFVEDVIQVQAHGDVVAGLVMGQQSHGVVGRQWKIERKRVVEGKSGLVLVELGGGRNS